MKRFVFMGFVGVILNYSMDFSVLKQHMMGGSEPSGAEILHKSQNFEELEVEDYTSIIDAKHDSWKSDFDDRKGLFLEQVAPMIPEPAMALLCGQSWWPQSVCQSEEEPLDESILSEHVKIWSENG